MTIVAGRFDELVERAKAAAKADLPSEAPDDALEYIGEDRVIERMPLEDLDVYRARLAGAWEAWSWACTWRGIASPIILAGLGAPTLLTQRQLPRPPRPEWWSRFTVLFTGRFVWDGGLTWDGEAAWDSRVVAPIETMDIDAARDRLRHLIRPWKSAHDRVTSAIIARGAWLWDDGEAWESAGAVWDAAVVTEIAAPTWDSPARWDTGWCWDYLL